MEDCYYCAAKSFCSSAVGPGSVVCMINKLKSGSTKEQELKFRQEGDFCQFCGNRLTKIGNKRFCNNVRCKNRFIDC